MNFLDNLTTKGYKNELHLKKAIEDNWFFDWPVIMGIASREEVNAASLKELQYLNGLADKKQEMTMMPFMGKGG
ncbi:hypothetical protein IV73_GL000177 [Weissella kandleri]|uniref:Uncharacterized protein n=1 Tax=Weissella kandleri TaxID=1616 RepID=A0A0R2JE78_9LACO|nr:hypothetical protein [Weissella kandleri]KRN75683.1 hypothetical protein IV73_GL000177 [Weissella kandleri]